MKKLVSILVIFCMSTSAFGDCDWNTGITPGPNHTFIYSDACHLAVGQLVQANKDLNSAIALKNLAIQTSDSRTMLWQKSADDEMSRLSTIETEQKHNDFLYFGLGIISAIGAGWMASKLIKN
jgi:hypothetical protein